jgi:type I restriction enzyme S subunit
MESKWRKVPIKEVYSGLFDGPHATPKPSDEGPVFLGIKNITEDGHLDLSDVRHIAEEDFPRWTKRVQPQEDDIVFTYEATLNLYALIPNGFRGCLGRRLALVRPLPTRVVPRFLYYYFFGEEWRVTIATNIIQGATVDRIPLIRFPDFQIGLPSLPTQRKIAAVLSAYDDLIENNTRHIAILEEMAQAVYREWFVNFCFPGHEKAKFVDSPLGKIPQGWEVVKLKELYRTTSGGTPSRKKPEFYENGTINWLKTKELNDRFIWDTEEKITDMGLAGSSAKVLPKRTVVMAMYGATIGKLGILAADSSMNQACCAFLTNESDYGYIYLFLYLLHNRSDIISLRAGAAQQNVSQDIIREIDVLKPRLEIVERFGPSTTQRIMTRLPQSWGRQSVPCMAGRGFSATTS